MHPQVIRQFFLNLKLPPGWDREALVEAVLEDASGAFDLYGAIWAATDRYLDDENLARDSGIVR